MKGRELMQFCWGAGSGSRHGAEPARACSYGGGVPRYVIAMAVLARHRIGMRAQHSAHGMRHH